MARKRRGRLLAGLSWGLLGLWTAGSGCHSVAPPAARSPAPQVRPGSPLAQSGPGRPCPAPASDVRLVSYLPDVIEPRSELSWSVQSAQLRPNGFMRNTD